MPDETAPTGAAPEPGQYDATLRPAPEQVPPPAAEEPQINPPPLEPETMHYRPSFEAGVNVGVPVWFRAPIDPGIAFEGRVSRRFGHIAPELMVGWQFNFLDRDRFPANYRLHNLTVDALYISLGARVYALENVPVNPFISAAFDLTFWNLRGAPGADCGWYFCTTRAHYDAGIGVSGKLGVAFLPSDRTQIDLGARFTAAFAVGPLEKVEVWLTPFVGVAAHL
jgi:hypothetical protein